MQEVMAAMSRLQVATETYAALGARLSISPTDDVAPEIVSALDDVLAAAGIDINTLEPQQRMMIAGLVRTMFAQSGDLLARPAREPGWSYTDSALLEGIGRDGVSSAVVRILLRWPFKGSDQRSRASERHGGETNAHPLQPSHTEYWTSRARSSSGIPTPVSSWTSYISR